MFWKWPILCCDTDFKLETRGTDLICCFEAKDWGVSGSLLCPSGAWRQSLCERIQHVHIWKNTWFQKVQTTAVMMPLSLLMLASIMWRTELRKSLNGVTDTISSCCCWCCAAVFISLMNVCLITYVTNRVIRETVASYTVWKLPENAETHYFKWQYGN